MKLTPLVILLVAITPAYAVVRVGDPKNPAALQVEIMHAYLTGRSKITVRPGTYVMPAGAPLSLKTLTNFEIDAEGVTISQSGAQDDVVTFTYCHNVRFQGATLRYNSPLFHQGTITNVGSDADGPFYDVQWQKGYATGAIPDLGVVIDRATHHLRFGSGDLLVKSQAPLNDKGLGRIHGERGRNMAVGDEVVFRGSGGALLRVNRCFHCTFVTLTFYWGGRDAILHTAGAENRFEEIHLIAGPAPVGTRERPLISTSARGFDCIGCRQGPLILNSTFEECLDDGISIHGTYCQVDHAAGTNVVIGAAGSTTDFQVGDRIRFTEPGTFSDTAAVTGVQKIDWKPVQPSKLDAFKAGNLTYFQITTDHPVITGFDWLADDLDACGAGFQLIDNTILNNRGRGIVIESGDGLVQDNTVDGAAMSGILLTTDPTSAESGDCWNITVQGNTVKNTTGTTSQGVGIGVTGLNCTGNQQLRIAGNKLENVAGTNLSVDGGNGVTVTDNVFRHPGQRPYPFGATPNATPVVSLAHCEDVSFTDNKIVDPGPHSHPILHFDRTAQGADEMTAGIVVVD